MSDFEPIDSVELERSAFDVGSEDFSLLRAVALLPRVAGRAVDVRAVEHEVNRYADLVAERLDAAGSIVAMHDVFFATAGFRGDEFEYDHPHNSFIDDVLRRRRGLPISLSVLMTEVAERAGIKAWGLALPGHFLTAVFADDERFAVVDAFAAGRLMPPEEVAERAGVPPSELGEVLQPASSHAVLMRMLVNLRGSYTRRGLHEPLARVLSRLLLLRRSDPQLFLARAAARRFLLDDDGVEADLDAAERLAPDDDDVARAVEALRAELQKGQIVN
jgi:regulator of sirC expression with transglutaminase-like and TPR domain